MNWNVDLPQALQMLLWLNKYKSPQPNLLESLPREKKVIITSKREENREWDIQKAQKGYGQVSSE